MILDGLLQFTGVLGTGDLPTTGTQVSTNAIDLHMAGIPILANLQGARDIGIGDDPALKLLIEVLTTFTVGTSLQVMIQGAPDNGSGAPGSYTTWWTSPVYAEATLVAGARLYDMDMPRPPAGVGMPRFLRLQYVSVGTHTTGALQAWILGDRHDQVYQGINNAVLGGYPAGINIAN